MTKGKIILGVAAAVVSVGSGLAFTEIHFGTHKVYGRTLVGVCKQCFSLWTNHSSGGHAIKCHTKVNAAGVTLYGQGNNGWTWYTKLGCNNSAVTRVTTTQ